jgi:hypothetical protein
MKARLVCCLLALSTAALAAPPEAGVRSEARERFDRGLTLFNQGDNEGALAEFERAFELTGNATVLYNIARVQAAAGDPVASLATLERLATGGLTGERKAQVDALRTEQQQRIGSLTLRVPGITGAKVEVDGADAGAVTDKPIALVAGKHVVAVLAPGYQPLRKTVLLAGREQKTLELTLEALQGAPGRLRISVEPMAVAVLLDGQELGKTPQLVEAAVAPGSHRLKLERPGYRSVERDISIPEGGALDVSEKLTFDPTSSRGRVGHLSVRASEDEAVVFVNGISSNDALAGVSLPQGPHKLRVERAGFVTSERLIEVTPGSSSVIDVTLTPTAQYRADYASSISTRRAWALGLGIGGVALAGAAGGYVAWNGGQVSDADAAFDAAVEDARIKCDPTTKDCSEAKKIAQIRKDDLDTKRERQVFGWVGVGVGAAALTTGVVLWLTSKDPHRYDPKPESDVFGSIAPWFGTGVAGLQVTRRLD